MKCEITHGGVVVYFPSVVYAASKAAVKLLTQVLAKEVGDRGITWMSIKLRMLDLQWFGGSTLRFYFDPENVK